MPLQGRKQHGVDLVSPECHTDIELRLKDVHHHQVTTVCGLLARNLS